MSPSSGPTCGGRARTAALVALLLVALPLQSGLVAASGAPAPPASLPVPFSLGFGPSSLSPVSQGVPIYTVGDTAWASSGFGSSVQLSMTSAKADPSAQPRSVTSQSIGPQVITPLHTFTSSDVDGVWNVTLASPTGTYVIPVHFVNPAAHVLSLGPLQYALVGGNLSIFARAELGASYDQEVCAGGDLAGAKVVMSLPADMHDTGSVTLIPGTPFYLVTSGQVNETVSFWFELYHPYGLAVGSANSVVVSNLMTAASQPITLASSSTSTTALTWSMPLREGRYGLRAYFQNSTSLEVVQSSVLIVNDSSWVSLSGSCRPLAIQPQGVSYSASLTGGVNSWPRTLYLMYRTFGVESVATYQLSANLSSVSFVASPWNQPLQDFRVNDPPAPGIAQTSQEGSTLFVLASRYPVKLAYTLDIGGGRDLAVGSVTINSSYRAQVSALTTAQLTVHIHSDQGALTVVDVTGPGGVNITADLAGNSPSSSLFLPGGLYTVTASQGDSSQSAQVSLTDGQATSIDLNLSAFPTLEVILAVTAIVAAVANVAIWVLRPRGVGMRVAAPE